MNNSKIISWARGALNAYIERNEAHILIMQSSPQARAALLEDGSLLARMSSGRIGSAATQQ